MNVEKHLSLTKFICVLRGECGWRATYSENAADYKPLTYSPLRWHYPSAVITRVWTLMLEVQNLNFVKT